MAPSRLARPPQGPLPTVDFERRQEWALKSRDEWPEICGLRYGARCAGRSTANVALFAERYADTLQARSLGRPGELEETMLEAADRYGLRASSLA